MRYAMLPFVLCLASAAYGGFTMDDDGKSLTLIENGTPVLVYHYGMVDPPKKVPERYRRACYIHPLYGLDGEVLTQDFPLDHRHHRGVFWAWPNSTLGDKPMDVWALDGIRQVHQRWLAKEVKDGKAEIAAENHWLYDDAPDSPKVRESVRIVVHPADDTARALDVYLKLENISDEAVTIRGATTDNKGYGGFCIRPDATRKPFTFTAAPGDLPEDMLRLESPWADVSYATKKDGTKQSGVAVFQHPGNPGYPHPGWITRGYGFLGVSWPHTEPHEMKPGDAFELRYRLYIHRGNAGEGKVKEAFDVYTAASE